MAFSHRKAAPPPSSSVTPSSLTTKPSVSTLYSSTTTHGRPLEPGLSWLAKKWCQREIQTHGESGHDPEADTRASVDFLRLKIQNGGGFGAFKTDQDSIFERMARACGRDSQGAVRAAVVDHGHPGVIHGAKATTAIACESDRKVLEDLIQAIPAHEFLFGRFTGIADAMGCECPSLVCVARD
jgi:RNA exonuclease 1